MKPKIDALILKVNGSEIEGAVDEVAAELPVRLVLNGEPFVTLLCTGELVGTLTDRASGAAFGQGAGNARRASVHAPPRPRLSNLILAGGTVEAPPRSAARLEVTSLASGSVQPHSGLLVLAVRTAWALRGGERQQPLRPCTLAAPVAAACAGLRAAGGTPQAIAEPGWCGKDGDVLATGAVTPWLLVAGLEVR